MEEQIIRLLISEKPYKDESFIGYIVRIAELNAVPDYRWIYKLVIPVKSVNSYLSIKTNLKIDREKFAGLFGISKREINRLLYSDKNIFRTRYCDLVIFDQIIEAHHICQENPKICPACLRENNYCRRIWEFLPLVICPFHKCLLIEQCPQCSQKISWQRAGISICNCQFDFRQTDLSLITDDELRFGRYFYRKLRYDLIDTEVELEYPLNGLDIRELLDLLLFVATHLHGIPQITPRNTLAYLSVRQIHEFFCEAVKVFDNWSENYHQFINEWQDKVANYSIFRPSTPSYENHIPARYKKYELLISELDLFDSENFEFLHYEFLNYLRDS